MENVEDGWKIAKNCEMGYRLAWICVFIKKEEIYTWLRVYLCF